VRMDTWAEAELQGVYSLKRARNSVGAVLPHGVHLAGLAGFWAYFPPRVLYCGVHLAGLQPPFPIKGVEGGRGVLDFEVEDTLSIQFRS